MILSTAQTARNNLDLPDLGCYWKADFSMLDEGVPCIVLANSGTMEVISVTSLCKLRSRDGVIRVSVGRDNPSDAERLSEENHLATLISRSTNLLGARLTSDGNLEFEFNRKKTSDAIASKEVFQILGIQEYWNSGKQIA